MVTVVGRTQIYQVTFYGRLWTNKTEGKVIQHMIYCSNQANGG